MSYKVYVNNQELTNPFVVVEQDGHRYILSNLIDFKGILWDLLMQTPAGQDISRDLVISELVIRGIFPNHGVTGPQGMTGISGATANADKQGPVHFA